MKLRKGTVLLLLLSGLVVSSCGGNSSKSSADSNKSSNTSNGTSSVESSSSEEESEFSFDWSDYSSEPSPYGSSSSSSGPNYYSSTGNYSDSEEYSSSEIEESSSEEISSSEAGSESSEIPPVDEEGHTVTFVAGEHCKVYVYAVEEEYGDPTEATTAKTRTAAGEIASYVAPVAGVDANEDGDYDDEGDTAPVAEVEPQVNFSVECDDGYIADGNCISISGTVGTEWGKLKSAKNADDDTQFYFNLTKIKADVTVTVTPRAVAAEEPAGYEATFVVGEHCTLTVYKGQYKDETTAIDDAEHHYSMDKKGNVTKVEGQFNFRITCDEGYEFVSGLEINAEAGPADVSFIDAAGHFANLKRVDTDLYRLTKVAGDLTINIAATPKAAA